MSRWNSKARAVRVFRYKRSDWVEEGLSGKKGLGQVVEEQGVWVLSWASGVPGRFLSREVA